MKRALAALALLASCQPAYADSFQTREIAFQALNAADAAQTCHIVGTGRGVELNPILGRHPKCGEVIAFKAGVGVLHYLLADYLRDRDPRAARLFQIATIAVQGGVVAANLRFTF